MDAANGSADESVMIALLPRTSDWCQIDLPHLTLVYGGLVKDLKLTAFNELAKDAAMLSMLTPGISLRVTGKKQFGDSGDVDVFTLQPSAELLAMRRAVESWNKSEFPFNPHVTIGPVGTYIEQMPNYIGFDRIMVGWGTERMDFWLRQ